MTRGTNTVPRSQPRRSARLIVVALAVLLSLSMFLALFLCVGRWLVVEDPLEKAQAIVVLSGRLPLRALEAARLYHTGYAPQIWLTRPEEPAASLEAMNIPYCGEEFYNTRVLVHEGVPSSAIRVLEPPINNTADELRAVATQLVRENGSAVILVTTKAHTRRVRGLWKELSGGHGRAIVRAATGDPFDPAHWWRTTGDALDVVREVLGLLNAWAGLPLHPGA
jgi:uncharacterized SAM-binding protein YcdF (DUF218 family)